MKLKNSISKQTASKDQSHLINSISNIKKTHTMMTLKNYTALTTAWFVLFIFSLIAFFLPIEFNQLIHSNSFLSSFLTQFDNNLLFSLFLITESVSFPYGAFTALVLVMLFCRLLNLSVKQSLILLIIVGVIVLVGLEIKSLIKRLTLEPRPYMLWLAEIAEPIKLNLTDYYSITEKSRKQELLVEIIHQPVFESQHIPNWLMSHWVKDSEYSFPSGHTFFASLFALLGVGLLVKQAGIGRIIAFGLVIWALLVMLSRLILGMHRPVDLMGGTLIALLCALIGIYMINKFILQSQHKDITN